MRYLGLLFLLLFTPTANAEDTEAAWVVDGVVSKRFAGDELQGPRFETEEEVQVVYREGELVRVKGKAGFGWLSKGAITSEAPSQDEIDIDALMERMKGLNLGGNGATSQPIQLGGGQ